MMSQANDMEAKGAVVAAPGSGQLESDSVSDALGTYLARVRGRSCVLPIERVQELTCSGLPEAAMSAAWWTDAEGWPASPAAAACVSVGWRVDSVTNPARLVRFVQIDRGAGPRSAG